MCGQADVALLFPATHHHSASSASALIYRHNRRPGSSHRALPEVFWFAWEDYLQDSCHEAGGEAALLKHGSQPVPHLSTPNHI